MTLCSDISKTDKYELFEIYDKVSNIEKRIDNGDGTTDQRSNCNIKLE